MKVLGAPTGASGKAPVDAGGADSPVSPNVWWLSPAGAIALVTLPTLLVAATSSDSRYRLAWGTPKSLTDETVLLFAAGALTMILASAVPMLLRGRTHPSRRWPALDARDIALLSRSAEVLFWLTMAGYAALAVSAGLNGLRPGDILSALLGQGVYEGDVKSALRGIPGVTTLTQVGMAFVAVAMLVLLHERDRRLRLRVVLVLALGLLRAAVATERLAVLELLVTAVAVLTFWWSASGKPLRHRAVALAPAVMLPLLLLIFGLFEYTRSWTWYSSRTTASYPEFIVDRLAGYYATAYNNGQLALDHESYNGRVPFSSIEAVWTAPGMSLLGGYPGPDAVEAHTDVLTLHGNPEFNSPGGLAIAFLDWGVVGGLLFLAVTGFLLGLLYKRCVEGSVFAVVIYPTLTPGLFELPRYLYWSLGRFTPSLVAICLVAYLLHRSRRDAGSRAEHELLRLPGL